MTRGVRRDGLAKDQPPRSSKHHKPPPVTRQERIRWKEFDIQRLHELARKYPTDRRMYDLAVERIRGEIKTIQMLDEKESAK